MKVEFVVGRNRSGSTGAHKHSVILPKSMVSSRCKPLTWVSGCAVIRIVSLSTLALFCLASRRYAFVYLAEPEVEDGIMKDLSLSLAPNSRGIMSAKRSVYRAKFINKQSKHVQ